MTPYYNHTDQLNSITSVSNNTGALTETLDYYPYGNQRISAGTYTNQRQYIGEMYDTNTGLDYLNARYQNGIQGRFISEDPVFLNPEGQGKEIFNTFLKNPQSQNSYSYAGDNPVTFSDPEGKWFAELLTGKQSWSSFSGEVGQATQYMSGGWQMAMNHPYLTGAVVGVAAGATAYGIIAVGSQIQTGINLGRLSELPQLSRVDTLERTDFNAIRNATGLTKSEAIQMIESTGKSLVETRPGRIGNINNISQIGDKIIRITTDPAASKIISSGVMGAASKVAQYISNGTMKALPTITNVAKVITQTVRSLVK